MGSILGDKGVREMEQEKEEIRGKYRHCHEWERLAIINTGLGE